MKILSIEKVQKDLQNFICKNSIERIGIGASGGPDSMVMLDILQKVCAFCGAKLFVLTVNHNIRAKEETEGDANFVLDFCKNLQNVHAEKHTIPRGVVQKLADERMRGTEDAARVLRYECFDAFIKKHNLQIFCLAHNKDDQIETLLQRFLQGSSIFGLTGIPKKRETFLRPLLETSKADILEYAKQNKIAYRIDKSNNENLYYRNKIRNLLIPFLQKEFAGFDSALLHGKTKAEIFCNDINSLIDETHLEQIDDKTLQIDATCFDAELESVKIQLLYKALARVGCKERLNFFDVQKACSLQNGNVLYFGDVSIKRDVLNGRNVVLLQKNAAQANLRGAKNLCAQSNFLANNLQVPRFYCYQIVQKRTITLPSPFNTILHIDVQKQSECIVLRNHQSADKIKCANGAYTLVSKVLANWKVPCDLRAFIPVLEYQNELVAIFACVAGKANWIVDNFCAVENLKQNEFIMRIDATRNI